MRAQVLLVEDDVLLRDLATEALEDADFAVTAAPNGDDAPGTLRADGFRLLVTDINMPGSRNGIAVAEHYRQAHP